jgi:hypothetical protein
MRTSDVYGTKNSLKAADLGNSRAKVVIEDAKLVKFDNGDKIVLSFAGKEKCLILNKTNAKTIEEMLGSDETDRWIGKSIVLYVAKVDYQGQRVPAIRVSDDPRDYPKASKAKAAPVEDAATVADEDEVPF